MGPTRRIADALWCGVCCPPFERTVVYSELRVFPRLSSRNDGTTFSAEAGVAEKIDPMSGETFILCNLQSENCRVSSWCCHNSKHRAEADGAGWQRVPGRSPFRWGVPMRDAGSTQHSGQSWWDWHFGSTQVGAALVGWLIIEGDGCDGGCDGGGCSWRSAVRCGPLKQGSHEPKCGQCIHHTQSFVHPSASTTVPLPPGITPSLASHSHTSWIIVQLYHLLCTMVAQQSSRLTPSSLNPIHPP